MDGLIQRRSERAAETLLLAFLATVVMLFAGFTSAYLIRRTGSDWARLELPPLAYANTLLLLGASGTLEPVAEAEPVARREGPRPRRGFSGGVRRPLGPRPLETALLHGFAEAFGTALVAAGGGLALKVTDIAGQLLDQVHLMLKDQAGNQIDVHVLSHVSEGRAFLSVNYLPSAASARAIRIARSTARAETWTSTASDSGGSNAVP